MDQEPPPPSPIQQSPINSPAPSGGSPNRHTVPTALKYSEMTPSQEPPPPQVQQFPVNSPAPAGGSAKPTTPNRLTVPKAFKYPEMYKSPTDQIMSPVSKGILARTKSKKFSVLLPPSSARNQEHKIQASKFQDPGALKT